MRTTIAIAAVALLALLASSAPVSYDPRSVEVVAVSDLQARMELDAMIADTDFQARGFDDYDDYGFVARSTDFDDELDSIFEVRDLELMQELEARGKFKDFVNKVLGKKKKDNSHILGPQGGRGGNTPSPHLWGNAEQPELHGGHRTAGVPIGGRLPNMQSTWPAASGGRSSRRTGRPH